MKPENEEDIKALQDAYKLSRELVCELISFPTDEMINKALMLHFIIENWHEPIIKEQLEKYRRTKK